MIYILCIADLRYKTSVMQCLRGEKWIGIGRFVEWRAS